MTTTTDRIISHRNFAKGAAAAFTAPLILRDSCFGAGASGDTPNLAFVGLGGRGNLGALAQHCNVVALCDVDLRKEGGCSMRIGKKERAALQIAGPRKFPGSKVCQDFRKMLLEMDDEIRTLQDLAKKDKLVTQMGNQGHAFEGMAPKKNAAKAPGAIQGDHGPIAIRSFTVTPIELK